MSTPAMAERFPEGANLPHLRKHRPRVEASTILEALYDLAVNAPRPARCPAPSAGWSSVSRGEAHAPTIAEIAVHAGVSRNTASDRLLDLSGVGVGDGFLVTRSKATESSAGPRPWVYTITQNGINAVLQLQAKRERLTSEVDLETQGERFDRAAEKLEREAEAIEARLVNVPAVDQRQIPLPTATEVYGIMSRSADDQAAWESLGEKARLETLAGGAA